MKRRAVIIAVTALVITALTGVFLYERSRVATIIDDELAWDIRDASPMMDVIVFDDGTVARYLGEDSDTYSGTIQDTLRVARTDAHVETWFASDGMGVVYLNLPGRTQVFSAPDSSSAVVFELEYLDGCVPVTYRCAGYRDDWFAIEIPAGHSAADPANANPVGIGYVHSHSVTWDVIDTF